MADSAVTERSREAPLGEMSYEEFLRTDWPRNDLEWVDGKVIPMSPVTNLHQEVLMFLLRVLTDFVEVHKAGTVFLDPFQMKTGPDLPGRAPDLFFVKKARLNHLKPVYFDGPGDVVIEIISPSSRGVDRGEKFYEYEQGGVPEFWLIDPPRKQAEFFFLGSDGIYHPAPITGGTFKSKVLKGFWLKVEWLNQHPLPQVRGVLKELRLL
jgi:Uma2 family endonuclease